MEGGRTILGSVITTVDNHGGNIYNCAYQTLRLISPRKVTVGLGEGTHNWERYRERVEATGDGLPAVAWIGHHPAACMGALTRVAIDVDEYSVIGGALGEPFQAALGDLGDKFLVPADAESSLKDHPAQERAPWTAGGFARYYSPETLRRL
jgi:UbiD family decarboxylase